MNRKPRRILATILPTPDSPTRLEDGESHHIRHVLRVEPGERVEAIDGSGRLVLAQLREDTLGLSLVWEKDLHPHEANAEVSTTIILEQAMVKPDALELIVEKAVELGVQSLRVFRSQHLGFKFNQEREVGLLKRLHKISLQSLKQCKRLREMEITSRKTLEELLVEPISGTRFFGAMKNTEEGKNRLSLLEVLQSKPPGPWHFVIGPEGGFSEKEMLLLLQSGAHPVSLGSNVLRAETAAIYCATLGQAFGNRDHQT